jgi:hypothetical protein
MVDLAHFARARDVSANTGFAAASTDQTSWYRPASEFTTGGGSLSAAVLKKLNVDSELGRFLGLVQNAIERLSLCQQLIVSGDVLGADGQFIACKPLFVEMLMFRDLSDAVGLVVLKCLQIATSVKAIVDALELPSVLERTLTRVRMAPFMRFEEACALADEIEEKATLEAVPGFIELSNALVEAMDTPSDPTEND